MRYPRATAYVEIGLFSIETEILKHQLLVTAETIQRVPPGPTRDALKIRLDALVLKFRDWCNGGREAASKERAA